MASDLALGVPERDLIPGDPDEIEVLVSRLSIFAAGMIEASEHLRDIQAGEWQGEAGDAFRLLVGDQPAHYKRAGSAFAEASRTTAQYAEVLREAQFDARRAVALYEQAEVETKDWKRRWDAHNAEVRAAQRAGLDGFSSPQPSDADPGAGDRALARRLLDEVRERVDTQARSTARVLQQAEEAAPKKPGLLDSILGGIGDYYKNYFSGFWDATLGEIWDSIEAFLDSPGQWVKDVWDNFYDQIAIWNWDTFKESWIEFGKDLVASDEWSKNPARALGIVMGNLTIFIAGWGVGGVVAKGTKRLLKTAADRRKLRNMTFDVGQEAKHLPDTPQSQRLIRKEGAAHVFTDEATMLRVRDAILKKGKPTGEVRGHNRWGMEFEEPIGYRIDQEGNRIPLHYGEFKESGGKYHVIPRTRPGR